MAFTTTDLEMIEAAIASGEKSLRFSDGRMVTYQDTSEMLKARDLITGELEGRPAARIFRLYQRGTGLS